MCDSDDEAGIMGQPLHDEDVSVDEAYSIMTNPSVKKIAVHLVQRKQTYEFGRHQAGFVTYGNVNKGDKVLIAASSMHEDVVGK